MLCLLTFLPVEKKNHPPQPYYPCPFLPPLTSTKQKKKQTHCYDNREKKSRFFEAKEKKRKTVKKSKITLFVCAVCRVLLFSNSCSSFCFVFGSFLLACVPKKKISWCGQHPDTTPYLFPAPGGKIFYSAASLSCWPPLRFFFCFFLFLFLFVRCVCVSLAKKKKKQGETE